MCKGWFHHPNTHWLTVRLWLNDIGRKGGDRPAGGNRRGSVRGWPGRSILFVGPLLRAHLLTTCQGRRWYCLTAAVRPPGAAPPGCPPLPVYTSRRQRRLVHRAELRRCTGGLWVFGHQQAVPGIYRCIACHYYYQRPKARVEYRLHLCYTLLVSIRQTGI